MEIKLAEKDDLIKNLVEKVNIVEKTLENVNNYAKDLHEIPASNTIEQVKNVVDIKEKPIEVDKEKEEILTCNLCSFKTQSKQGMKSHKTKKHKEVVSHCGFCDLDFTCHRDFHVHMNSEHSGISSPIINRNFPPRLPRSPISIPRNPIPNGFYPPFSLMGPRW